MNILDKLYEIVKTHIIESMIIVNWRFSEYLINKENNERKFVLLRRYILAQKIAYGKLLMWNK